MLRASSAFCFATCVAPWSTSVVRIYKDCRKKDDTVLTSATPKCEILEYTSRDGKAYDVREEIMSFDSTLGRAEIFVPPHAWVRVVIPEIDMDNTGYVGEGGTNIEADNLYAERQI